MSQVSLNKRTSSFGIQPTKDPRPIRDKAWQQSATASLIAFLAQAGYPHPVSKKNLVAPSQKDFINMFTFLYGLLDPNFEWKGRFDDDFTLVLKGLRYPFEISKSQLQSVGSMHAWPSLLAVLTWLVELIVVY